MFSAEVVKRLSVLTFVYSHTECVPTLQICLVLPTAWSVHLDGDASVHW